MRLVHLADLHLGYRQYQRLTPAGINQREADAAAALTRAVEKTIAIAPDVIVIAGDFFHQVRPANPAILHAFGQMARLARALPKCIIVVIAGNHDTPRSRDTVCILRLFTQLGMHVVDAEPKQLQFADQSLSVFCVPHQPLANVELTPDPTARFNVLVAHGEVRGTLPDFEGRERASLILEPDDIDREGWDYVALGHYHVHKKVGRRAWYSGAIEYTGTNVWAELREEADTRVPGKGLIEFDLETGKHTFHALPGSRAYIDLPPVEGRGLGAEDLDGRIAGAVERCPGGIEDKVVRLIVNNVTRQMARDLNHKAIREYKKRALHFQLDVMPPELTRSRGAGAAGRMAPLADLLRTQLVARPLDAELDRDRFVELGVGYLAKVEGETASSAAERTT